MSFEHKIGTLLGVLALVTVFYPLWATALERILERLF